MRQLQVYPSGGLATNMSRKDEELGMLGDSEYESEEDAETKAYNIASCYEDTDHVELPPEDLDEDTFGFAVCSLTRDTHALVRDGASCARSTRLFTSLFLVIITIGLQIALLHYVKEYVSAKAVHDIRISYDKYEEHVYGCNVDAANCTLTINGKHRGITYPGDEVAWKVLMSPVLDDHRSAICHIPLSHPGFLRLVLGIWVLTCIGEVRKACNLGYTIANLDSTNTMANAIDSTDDGEVITRMTGIMKVLLLLLTFVPRLCITIYLTWVGMRWLLATTSFGDLILNAVALEFILLIKEVIYAAVMPTRNHHDLQQTKIVPSPRRMSAAWFNLTGSVSLLGVTIIIVWAYMNFWQAVLPEYHWDVRTVCAQYIAKEYTV